MSRYSYGNTLVIFNVGARFVVPVLIQNNNSCIIQGDCFGPDIRCREHAMTDSSWEIGLVPFSRSP
jgi:hypothetical protein